MAASVELLLESLDRATDARSGRCGEDSFEVRAVRVHRLSSDLHVRESLLENAKSRSWAPGRGHIVLNRRVRGEHGVALPLERSKLEVRDRVEGRRVVHATIDVAEPQRPGRARPRRSPCRFGSAEVQETCCRGSARATLPFVHFEEDAERLLAVRLGLPTETTSGRYFLLLHSSAALNFAAQGPATAASCFLPSFFPSVQMSCSRTHSSTCAFASPHVGSEVRSLHFS